MFLNVARVSRGGKTYQYGQLVESFRRPDGMPSRRTVASLGQLTQLEVDNLRSALAASKLGERVALPKVVSAKLRRPTENLRYLDVAVLVSVIKSSGLYDLLDRLLPQGGATVAPADVISALVVQRCVEPGSKLFAERWFPTTALPELLGVSPESFNNTRIHRVLDDLDEATEALMDRLPHNLVADRATRAVTSMFLDLTDAVFTSEGPELADRGKTKLGTIERKVGIVLVCDELGLPLRWQVVAGQCPEPEAMHAMVRQIRGRSWTGHAPLVMDRAMGTSHDIRKLLGQGIRFVLALRDNEVMSYAKAFSSTTLDDADPSELADADGDKHLLADVERRIGAADFRRVTDTMFVRDFGIVEREAPSAPSEATQGAASAQQGPASPGIVEQLTLARQMKAMHQLDGRSLNAAARALGLPVDAAKGMRLLLKLSARVQERILTGEGGSFSRKRLARIGRLTAEEQEAAFDAAIAEGHKAKPVGGRTLPRSVDAQNAEDDLGVTIRVRAVIAFNPQRFIEERRGAKRLLSKIATEVALVNAKLARGTLSRVRAQRSLDKILRGRGLVEAYDISWKDVAGRSQVTLALRGARWCRRRAMDGFLLHLAHPDVDLPAEEICNLYRAKDAVEKDFQTIKSFVKLQPVRHFTDAKVRAHVTICVLALLIERLLGGQLDVSAPRALEVLSTGFINRYATKNASEYLLTEPTDEHRNLLRRLTLLPLVDDDAVAAVLRPR